MKTSNIVQPPVKAMNAAQLTVAVHNLSRAVKRLEGFAQGLEQHEHLIVKHANQMKELLIASRCSKETLMKSGLTTPEQWIELMNTERAKFEEEIKRFQIENITEEINNTVKALSDQTIKPHLKTTLEGHLASLRAHLEHLSNPVNGESNGTVSTEETTN